MKSCKECGIDISQRGPGAIRCVPCYEWAKNERRRTRGRTDKDREIARERYRKMRASHTSEERDEYNRKGAIRALSSYHRNKTLVQPRKRFCRTCKADISTRFHNAIWCKDCVKERQKGRMRSWQQKPEIKQRLKDIAATPQYRGYQRQYRQSERGRDAQLQSKHRRRVREASQLGHVTKGIKRIRLEQQGYKCPMCGKGINYGNSHLEHMIPLSKGGLHDDENLWVMCKSCNLRKGTKLVSGQAQLALLEI